MRYFKYEHGDASEKTASAAKYDELAKRKRRFERREKALNVIGFILFLVVNIVLLPCCIVAINHIPAPNHPFAAILFNIGTVVLGIVAFVICLILGILVALPVFGIGSAKHEAVLREMRLATCEHLREYYELSDSCIVTKCYESTDKRFNKKDVCIFAVGDELRITVNLKNGFFSEEKDLGCYAFSAEEISVSELQGDELVMTKLKSEDTVFLLGYRASRFIKKSFASR